jgi:hypothetical protein
MWFKRKITKAAEMIIWLHQSDPEGWKRGTHSTVHVASGIGVWTGNGKRHLHVEYDCDPSVGQFGSMRGTKVELSPRDKKAIWNEFKPGKHPEGQIVRAIFEWSLKNKCTPKQFEDAA